MRISSARALITSASNPTLKLVRKLLGAGHVRRQPRVSVPAERYPRRIRDLDEHEVRLESERPVESPLGPGRRVVFRVLKPF